MSTYLRGSQWKSAFAGAACFFLLPATIAVADGTVSGVCRFERVKGRPGSYIELYEWNIFLAAEGGFVNGKSYRCGHEYGGGTYHFESAAGDYTMYVNQPLFFARPKLVAGVQIHDSQTTTINPELAIDYSCYVTNDWSWDSPYYQTFVATGTSINRLQWRLAGWNASRIEASVHHNNGGNVTTWPQIGPTKSAGTGYGDAWTGYRSGDIPTVPGETYAIKLTGVGGDFGIMSRAEDGNGYAQGQAYDHNGNPQNRDLNITVFSDNDNTVIPYAKTTSGLGSLSDWAGVWGQTFKATGEGLAAADLWFASTTWDIDVRFRVYTNNPSGTQIGPTKVSAAAAQTGGVGLVGVSYAPGEVPLTTGNTYYIEMAVPSDPWGFTPYKFNNPVDDYPYGHAYMSGGSQTSVDLSMTIMEYGSAGPPEIERHPASLTPSVTQGSSPPSDTFTVRNSGGGVMSYTISDNVGWLSVDPPSGASAGEADLISIIYNTSGLGIGSHVGTITINAPDATNTPQTVIVHLSVVEAPAIERDPASFSPTVPRGDTLPDDIFTVRNSGGGTLDYVITDNAGWLSVNPPGGSSSGETDTIHIVYDVASLAMNSYTGTITISAPGASNTPQYVVVHLTVEAPEFAPCDFDEDGDVDQEDFGQFQACYSGAGIPQNDPDCDGADLHQDGDVDRDDFARFQQCISGPNVPADPLCAD